jgi:dihydrofolate reductase
MIKIIVTISKNRVIVNNNQLTCSLPADLRKFKKITTNNSIVMDRKTYESIGNSLPNRRKIIITRDNNYKADGCEIVNSIEEALMLCNNDCFIIGGGEIYKQSIDIADKIYLTFINKEFEGDTFFPEIGDEWIKVSREDHESDDKNNKYSFIEYEKYKF